MLRSRVSLDADFDILSQSRCPMCHAPVDEGLLKKAGNMNTRQQEKFCRSHQRDTAKALWREKDYPDIDFETLSSRILRHHDFIQNLIQGQDCHFRQVLDDAVKGGTDRTLLKSTRNLTPGYYGSRGLKIISEHIMHQFTPLLKRVAVTDSLMIARGVTPFVQLVLVPEVTTLLIKEDLDVDEARARAVLTESASLGEIMHEESKDVVHIAESDVDENIDIG
ncbi:RTC4-like domain-containing protein [Bisporella sp. PMI_857]|nr:RTC4-like domain-containing protein [Bisporella sp. PMI_857]